MLGGLGIQKVGYRRACNYAACRDGYDDRFSQFLCVLLVNIRILACGYVLDGEATGLHGKEWVYLVMTLVLNMILTILTGELIVPRSLVILPLENANESLAAGRIWWLASKAKLILDSGLLRRYSATITILYVCCTLPNTFAKQAY